MPTLKNPGKNSSKSKQSQATHKRLINNDDRQIYVFYNRTPTYTSFREENEHSYDKVPVYKNISFLPIRH